MLHIERWKIVLILTLTVLGVLYAVPNVMPPSVKVWLEENMPSALPGNTINLGLDLRGGSHLLLEADTRTVISDRLDSMVDAVRTEMRKKNIGYTDLGVKRDGVTFKLRNLAQDRDAAWKIARGQEQNADINVSDDGRVDITLGKKALKEINTQVINHSIEIVRRRIDESGTKEPVIQRQGINRIVVQLPGVDDPERVKELLGRTAKMSFHLVDMDASETDGISPGSKRMLMREEGSQTIIVKKRVMISGDMLVDSQPTFEQGAPVVSFRFNALGARRFCDVTRDNVGKPFAIVLDNEVISAPRINEAICGGSGMISGSFTVKEAHDLSLLLRAGALPAPLNVVEERSVGPTLGSDSIAAGEKAAVVGLILVFLFMMMVYGIFGVFANIALTLNIIFIIAILSALQATLTLPGIAGIILTIGIAVDANVLIYERIREELRQGRTILAAVDSGYRLALPTITDSNLTTLIVAFILFSFGTGPIKGFAVTMCVGTATSLFSAIMITRLMVIVWLRKTRPTQLYI
ncbi:MAG: protein translocase subunit SecD [Alphaproteobacteria bacterium]|nr:protein translocase subunit SecD [Alphaproteobacteria bacterium]